MIKPYYDVVVVGGGPAGSMAARYAAKAGVSVLILEKDRDIGYPVRCGEAIGKTGLDEFIPLNDKFIAARIDKFSMNAPDGTSVVLESNDAAYILERRVFDYELAKTAAEKGAHIQTRVYVNGLILEGGCVCGVTYEYRGEAGEVRCKVVVAADGVESRVGRWAGIKTHVDIRDMESCAQVTVSNVNIQSDTICFYFGKEVAPEGYFWIFPKGNSSANMGLGVSGMIGKKKSALRYLNEFMEKRYPEAAVLTQIAGGVPCGITLKKISAPGIVLAGDAACQVNPLSGGGIASGMIGGSIGGRIAAESILRNKPEHLLTYDKAWHDRLGKRHEVYDRLKRGVYNFSDEKFNSLARAFNKVPFEKRTLGTLFRTALINSPSLLLDVAKVFLF